MNKFKRLNGTCLVAATLMLHAPQVVMAEGDTTWGISGWINEGMTYYDDGDKSGTAQCLTMVRP